jgi:hypothetical protein
LIILRAKVKCGSNILRAVPVVQPLPLFMLAHVEIDVSEESHHHRLPVGVAEGCDERFPSPRHLSRCPKRPHCPQNLEDGDNSLATGKVSRYSMNACTTPCSKKTSAEPSLLVLMRVHRIKTAGLASTKLFSLSNSMSLGTTPCSMKGAAGPEQFPTGSKTPKAAILGYFERVRARYAK